MLKIALIFPGQGAQRVGMGREFYDSSSEARAIFEEADGILQNGLSKAIFEGPQEKLTLTAFCQPAILTMSVAALRAFEAHPEFKNVDVKFTAGLSLGEYSSLVAAGALSFADALRLVERRSFFMEEATKIEKGTMAAIIGFDRGRLLEICQKTGAQVANYNSPEQVVITGYTAKVAEACRLIQEAGAKNVVPLEVSGAFHSTLMQPASDRFVHELGRVNFHLCKFSVISNVHAQPQINPKEIQENLAKQIVSSVRWEESVRFMAAQGIQDFIEVGPGKVLKGLIRRTDSALSVYNIEKPSDIEQLPL